MIRLLVAGIGLLEEPNRHVEIVVEARVPFDSRDPLAVLTKGIPARFAVRQVVHRMIHVTFADPWRSSIASEPAILAGIPLSNH